MSQLSAYKPLSTELLAGIFQQLAQMEAAGLPATQAFSLLERNNKALNQRLNQMQQAINSGSSIADAGFNAKIFNKTHKMLINAAEESGKLAEIYKQLANYYADKLRRLKKIQSRLYLPCFVLFLALCIEPIPLFFNGNITAFSYLSLSIGRFLLIAVVFYIFYKVPVWFKSVCYSLQLQLPKISNWIIKRQVNDFLLILAIMLDAGVAFSEALPTAVATIKNPILQKRFKKALINCRSGDSVTQILSDVDVIEPVALQIINSGEASGKLAEAILHFASREAESIYLQDEMLAEWLPRLFSIGVALWMIASLLGV